MTGKKMTLADLFAKREAEIKAQIAAEDAYRQTPEGKAEYEAAEALRQRLREADERAWEGRSPWQKGWDAHEAGEDREAPEGLSDSDALAWLSGWDEAEAASEEDEEE